MDFNSAKKIANSGTLLEVKCTSCAYLSTNSHACMSASLPWKARIRASSFERSISLPETAKWTLLLNTHPFCTDAYRCVSRTGQYGCQRQIGVKHQGTQLTLNKCFPTGSAMAPLKAPVLCLCIISILHMFDQKIRSVFAQDENGKSLKREDPVLQALRYIPLKISQQ